jgi:hypothetical protein
VGSTRDRFRVREDLSDDEGRLLLAFYRDVAEGKEPVPPDVSPRARWWWPDEDAEAVDADAAAEPSVPLPTVVACEAAAANDVPEHDVDSGT